MFFLQLQYWLSWRIPRWVLNSWPLEPSVVAACNQPPLVTQEFYLLGWPSNCTTAIMRPYKSFARWKRPFSFKPSHSSIASQVAWITGECQLSRQKNKRLAKSSNLKSCLYSRSLSYNILWLCPVNFLWAAECNILNFPGDYIYILDPNRERGQ